MVVNILKNKDIKNETFVVRLVDITRPIVEYIRVINKAPAPTGIQCRTFCYVHFNCLSIVLRSDLRQHGVGNVVKNVRI